MLNTLLPLLALSASMALATSTVTVNTLSQSGTALNGTAQASAAGMLSPFGNIGIGCGINWLSDESFGGGLQAGSDSFGLGGGYTVNATALEAGVGLSVKPDNKTDITASVQVVALNSNGHVSFDLKSNTPIVCAPSVNADGEYHVVCTAGGSL